MLCSTHTHTHTHIYSVPGLSSCHYLMSLKGVCKESALRLLCPLICAGMEAISVPYPAGTDSPPSFWPPAAGISSVFQGKQPCLQHLANCAPVWACGRNRAQAASQCHQAGGTGLLEWLSYLLELMGAVLTSEVPNPLFSLFSLLSIGPPGSLRQAQSLY